MTAWLRALRGIGPSGRQELLATGLLAASGLAILATLAAGEGRLAGLLTPGGEMWIKLFGLVFAGVFLGATIHEVTSRRRERQARRLAAEAETAPAAEAVPALEESNS